jgi:L(+)-tartrate dehydratase beta subunit
MHYDLAMPVTDEAVRRLRINDTVTLQERLFGIRDATQIALFDRGRTTRLDLRGHAVIHTAPNVRKVEPSAGHPTGYAPVCIGTTTSMRMERFTLPLMRDLGVRIVIGKGGLGPASLAAFAELGGLYDAVDRAARDRRGAALDALNVRR